MAERSSIIEFRTLGGLDIQGVDRGDPSSVLAHGKRTALLAYLAVARPRGFHRRDTLIALLWPELDEERARAALRKELYNLRQSLGATVVSARGNEELLVESEQLWCDAAAFEQALDAGDPVRALELYRGPFLKGLFLSGALEFERWVERERSWLQKRAFDAAWLVAEQAERKGDAYSAAFWARRAAALVPDDEGALRRLLEFLLRIGDHAGTIAAYEEFARRLRADYDIEPSAETRALIRTLRAGSAFPAEIAGGSPPDLMPRSRGSVVVLPFSIAGTSEVGFLREGMVELLSHSLSGVAGLHAFDPGSVIRLADSTGPGSHLDAHRARELADRVGAELFVLGTAIEHAGRVRLHARLYDRADPRRPAAESAAEGPTSELFELVDRIAAGLLVERIGPASASLTRTARPTRSLAAFKAYLRGEQALRERNFEAAIGEFHQATAEDGEFALASYRLAVTAGLGEADNVAADALEKALAHASRLPEQHRRLVQAYAAFHQGRADEAESAYRLLLRDFPDSIEARFQLGDVLFRYNPLRGRSAYEAREHFQLVADIDAGFLCPI